MSELLLVRHGQGGATPAGYDELSPLGWVQAQRLGAWLLAHQREYAALLVGRMRRQRETLQAIRAAYAEAGRTLPEPQVLPGLDEYQFGDLVRAFAARHPQHPELAVVHERPTDKRLWIGLLRTTLAAWTREELPEAPESYAQFQGRTRAALARIAELLPQGPVLAVSSGGVMSQFAQQVLGFGDQAAIDLNLALLNTAVCEYRWTRHGTRLISLNTLPHLAAPADRELITLV